MENINDTNSKMTKSLRLDNEQIELIAKWDLCNSPIFSEQVRNMSILWDNAMCYGKTQIIGIFTKQETALICQAFNGNLMSDSTLAMMPQNKYLEMQIFESIKWDSLDTFYEVDGEKLLEKIRNLDYMACVAVMHEVIEFWNSDDIKRDLTKLSICEYQL